MMQNLSSFSPRIFWETLKTTASYLMMCGIAFDFFPIFSEYKFYMTIVVAGALLFTKGREMILEEWKNLDQKQRITKKIATKIEKNPQETRDELISIYKNQSLSLELAEQIVDKVIEYDAMIIKTLLWHKYRIPLQISAHPVQIGYQAIIAIITGSVLFYLSSYIQYGATISQLLLITAISLIFWQKNHQGSKSSTFFMWDMASLIVQIFTLYFLLKMGNP